MNRIYTLLIVALCTLSTLSMHAQTKSKSTAALVAELTQLRYSKMPLKATIPAVELLKRNPNHSMAVNFLRKDFETAEKEVLDELETIAFVNTLDEAQRRFELVSLLASAYEQIESLDLPLEGDGWTWHPGIKYYAGSVSEAQVDLVRIAENQAKEESNRNNPAEAYRCYKAALDCLTDSGEVHSNRQHYARLMMRRGDEVANGASNLHILSIAKEFYDKATLLNADDTLLQERKSKCDAAVEALKRPVETTDTLAALTLPQEPVLAPVEKDKYTFGDFFNALDLPTVLGVGFTPTGIESAAFNSAMRLGWRQHKNYGIYSYLTYDTHTHTYDSLVVVGSNVRTGEVLYNEIGISIGYRLPLVANIRSFYQNPYFNSWNIFASVSPGISIATVKNMVSYDGTADTYEMKNYNHTVPTVRFSAGLEWFIFSNFSVFAEASYTQHLIPTLIEYASIQKGTISKVTGPVTISLGLSLFFT